MSDLDFPENPELQLTQQLTDHVPTNRELMMKMFHYLSRYMRLNGRLTEQDKGFVREVMTRFAYVDLLLSRIERVHGPMLPKKYHIDYQLDALYPLINPMLADTECKQFSMVDLMEMDHYLNDLVHNLYHPDPKHSLMERLAISLMNIFKKTER